jgi:hypothetical protein
MVFQAHSRPLSQSLSQMQLGDATNAKKLGDAKTAAALSLSQDQFGDTKTVGRKDRGVRRRSDRTQLCT